MSISGTHGTTTTRHFLLAVATRLSDVRLSTVQRATSMSHSLAVVTLSTDFR